MYFEYGDKEIEYLKSKDKILARVIDDLGHVYRKVDSNLFEGVIHHIIGQQISVAAVKTIYQRLINLVRVLTPKNILAVSDQQLQKCGITFRKVNYIKSFCRSVVNKEIDLNALIVSSDQEVIEKLSSLNGIGVWTAEMLMISSMGRKDILSYGDLAILRGMRMVYHHRKITKKLFDKYRRRFTPYNTIAAIYFWEVASGRHAQYKDYLPKNK